MRCPSCGEENPDRFRLCGFCGTELPAAVATEARKVVTLVFADVTGSTALGERLDAESVRWIMSSFFVIAREVLERHGGTVEKFIGDAVMAAFGIPQAREDDALRGIRAAAELRDRLHAFGCQVEERFGVAAGVRIGVNTGEVVAGDAAAGQAFASGDAVNVAARLEQAAAAGEVLLGEGTLRLVRDAVSVEALEPLALKGKPEAVAAWRLLEVATGEPGISRRFDSPLVGRASELAQLTEAWRRSVAERQAQVVTIVAPAGTGKTRLVAEFTRSVQPGGQVLVGRCLPYGDGITFWPVAEAMRQAAGVADDDSAELAERKLASLVVGEDGVAEILERLAPAVGLPGAAVALEETFWAVRKLFEAVARRRPLLLVVDDVHWAEEAMLDLVEYLGWTRGVPMLLVCSARPELLERRPGAAGPRANGSTLLLQPLGAEGADELMLWQLGATPLPDALRESVLAAAEGNPLFVQELVRMLIDEGLVVRRDGEWEATTDARGLAMPPTIQALLAARLDQLDDAERDIAQRASVVGHVFWSGAVRDLCAELARQGVGARLHTLVRKEMIVPEVSTFAAEDAFRFGHILVRDAAYAGLAKRTRAELHERFAGWLEGARGGRLSEHEEILGYHLEQAAIYRNELGDAGDFQRVAVQASARLATGGRRALAAGDLHAAANLLGRASDVLPGGVPQRLALRLESIPALVETSQLEGAAAGLDEILAQATDGPLVLAARAWRGYLDAVSAGVTFEDGRVAIQAWLAACEETEDVRGQATALGLLATMRFQVGCSYEAEGMWEKAAEQAARCGDHRAEADALMWWLIAALYGPTAVPLGLERCKRVANQPVATRKVKAIAMIQRGVLSAMQGEIAGGREAVARGRQEMDELGLVSYGVQQAADVEQLAGDHPAAEAILRPALARLAASGEWGRYSTDAGMLAQSLYAQDRFEEAETCAESCRDLASLDDVSSQILWRGVLAKLRARDGSHETAVELAEAAVALVTVTDLLTQHADRLVDLAEVHVLGGRRADALEALDQAGALYSRKGSVTALAATRRWRAALG